jgi:hypothetical protein
MLVPTLRGWAKTILAASSPGDMTVQKVAATQEQSIPDLEIAPARFGPADQMRPEGRTAADEITINPAQMIDVPPFAG